MADPIWLDTSTIGNIADGDKTLEAEIQGLGVPLLMVPKVREELLSGNPFQPDMRARSPEQVEAAKAVLTRLNITLDMSGSAADRAALFERQFKFKTNGSTVVRAIEESDAIVLSQVAASATARSVAQPTFITTDGRLARNADARLFGVEIRMPSTPPGDTGGGGVGGVPAGATTISIGRVTPGAGAANAGALMMGFQIVDVLANYFNANYQDAAVRAAINLEMSGIRTYQKDHPAHGALVVLTFSRTVPNDPTGVVNKTILIHPGDNFEYIDEYFETSPIRAIRLAASEREVRRDLGVDSPYKLSWGKKMFWINPDTPALESPVGRWQVKVGRWTWIYEFDDQGTVVWTDPFSKDTGKGRYRIGDLDMTTTWEPSPTVETWDFPLDPLDAFGRCNMLGSGNFQLQAQKL
jgi:hypothetical protein